MVWQRTGPFSIVCAVRYSILYPLKGDQSSFLSTSRRLDSLSDDRMILFLSEDTPFLQHEREILYREWSLSLLFPWGKDQNTRQQNTRHANVFDRMEKEFVFDRRRRIGILQKNVGDESFHFRDLSELGDNSLSEILILRIMVRFFRYWLTSKSKINWNEAVVFIKLSFCELVGKVHCLLLSPWTVHFPLSNASLFYHESMSLQR